MFDMGTDNLPTKTIPTRSHPPETDIGAISLYVHIPFCETKCPYCDFNTYTAIESLMPSYISALKTEISLWGSHLGRPRVTTVFFGGGTPSYLPAADIESLLKHIRTYCDLDISGEISLECNPGDVTRDKLSSYLDSGVNRLSIGVQSFSDSLLHLLGRRHTSSDAIHSYQLAIESGFENVSIDLMYGLPNQTPQDWRTTLEIAREMEPAHLSMYCLTLEDGTPMKKQVQIGTFPSPDADLAADMYMMCDETFSHPDYRHYEISNWAKPGNESVHNLTYWRNESFLGIGPGSHSYINGHRFWNIKPPREYITRLKPCHMEPTQSTIPNIPVIDEIEPIDRKMEIAETMMMGLRLDTGICIDQFSARFSVTPTKHFGSIISELESNGLVEQSSNFIKLTAKGRLLGNEVFSSFFL